MAYREESETRYFDAPQEEIAAAIEEVLERKFDGMLTREDGGWKTREHPSSMSLDYPEIVGVNPWIHAELEGDGQVTVTVSATNAPIFWGPHAIFDKCFSGLEKELGISAASEPPETEESDSGAGATISPHPPEEQFPSGGTERGAEQGRTGDGPDGSEMPQSRASIPGDTDLPILGLVVGYLVLLAVLGAFYHSKAPGAESAYILKGAFYGVVWGTVVPLLVWWLGSFVLSTEISGVIAAGFVVIVIGGMIFTAPGGDLDVSGGQEGGSVGIVSVENTAQDKVTVVAGSFENGDWIDRHEWDVDGGDETSAFFSGVKFDCHGDSATIKAVVAEYGSDRILGSTTTYTSCQDDVRLRIIVTTSYEARFNYN